MRLFFYLLSPFSLRLGYVFCDFITLVALALIIFTTSAFAGSCPMMAGKLKTKIEQAQQLHDAGMKAHSEGNHSKSEELLNKALDLFKS